MRKYNSNYLNVISTIYPLPNSYQKYLRGVYVINDETKYGIVKKLGSDAWVLYEFFYSRKNYKHFKPTDDAGIGEVLGWSKSKVTRVKSVLKADKLLLILKDTMSDGTLVFRTLLSSDLITHYDKHKTIPIASDTKVDVDTSNTGMVNVDVKENND